jgi:hypothetical protein
MNHHGKSMMEINGNNKPTIKAGCRKSKTKKSNAT